MKYAIFLVCLVLTWACGAQPVSGGDENEAIMQEWSMAAERGGILRVTEAEINRIGYSNKLATPSACVLFGTPIWDDLRRDPLATETGILTAAAKDPGNTRSLAITFDSPITNANVGMPVWADLKAHLLWGAGGDQAAALVDIANGSQVNVAASSVRISVIYTSIGPNPPMPGYNPQELTAGASIGYGTRAPYGPPTFTQMTDVSHGGAPGFPSTVVRAWAPAFARAVTVYDVAPILTAPPPTYYINVTFYNGSPGGWGTAIGGGQQSCVESQKWDVPGGATRIAIGHTHTLTDHQFIVVWDLAL